MRVDWITIITATVLAVSGCGGGCGGCDVIEPIPGGFPAAQRNPNAVQLRVTQSGLQALTADPQALISALGGSLNGIELNLTQMPGDDARLVLEPLQNQSTLRVTVRARVRTLQPIQANIPVAGNCDISLNTLNGSNPDIELILPLQFTQDAQAGTTKLVVGASTVNRLESADVNVSGGGLCGVANIVLPFAMGLVEDQISGMIGPTIQEQACKACPSGQTAECAPFGTACTDNVCMKGNECLQELGIAGRIRGSALFSSLSPGTTGALDLYEVLGGYATTQTNGIALGMLGGMRPGGVPRDRCGPAVAAPPPLPTIATSTFFQGNTRPDTGAAYGVGIGLHKSQLEHFAYAAYDGGLLCLTLSANTVAQLSTDTFALISRSLGKLVTTNSPMAVGLRPQSPPSIVLGKNTFTTDGGGNTTLTDPLLDLSFQALELDFFAAVDDQYIRVFTVVSDVRLPIGLQVTSPGELGPVLGDIENAFTNISVKNSEAVTETPQQLADLFPTVLGLVLPQLSGALPAFALPALGPLSLEVTDITGVPQAVGGSDVTYLAIFANLAPATAARPVDTRATLGAVIEPLAEIARDAARWRGATPPRVELELGAGGAAALEYSHRIDDGTWSAWSRNARPTISSRVFWLPGTHKIEVRAREVGRPETIDPTPAVVEVTLGEAAVARAGAGRPFHGQPGEGGCECSASGSGAQAAPLLLVLGVIVLPLRRARRRARDLARRIVRPLARLGALPWLVALALLPGCDCGSAPCGDAECLPGDLTHGALGRWTSIAGDASRVLVATYDQGLGDLVVVDVTNPDAPQKIAVDGIPGDVEPTYDPSSYRGGVEGAGPDVGAWTSIAIAGGNAMVAYQDREAGALKFAYEHSAGKWSSHVVDSTSGADVGRYASLVVDANGRPAVAYVALGLDAGDGTRTTELRLARASAAAPDSASRWSTSVIATGVGSCAGLCGSGEACIQVMAGQACTAVTSDCSESCGGGDACVAGACTSTITSEVADIGSGTGLFVSLVVLPDGRLAAAYYDRNARALALAVEDGPGASTFTETVLHDGAGDRGLWASAAVDGSGVVHVAYQDAIGDQLLYTTWDGGPGTPEVVDDGQRDGDRPHPVGAAAAIYLANGAPAIAYQDGMTADVYLATHAGTWSTTPVAGGPLLDGFSIGATTGPGGSVYLAWHRLDPAQEPASELAVLRR